ncbi:MAG: DNA methyltransferase [Spirochaetales bacterium]|nr:DNA methyltransferase [Spirochaetales bacterium]
MEPTTQQTPGVFDRIRAVLRTIPAGRVVSYGQVAAWAGFPRGARIVVWVLRTSPGLPWHRVIRANGQLALSDPLERDLQRQLLEAEFVTVTNNKVSADFFLHKQPEFDTQ